MPAARLTRRSALGLATGLAAASCGPLLGGPQKLRLLVGSGAGSASDGLARMMAAHWSSRLGAAVAVEDEPRGGGKVAAVKLASARPDGGLIGLLPTGLLYSNLVGEAKGWDLAAFGWLGSSSMDRRVLIAGPRSGLNSFEDVLRLRRPMTLATTSAAAPGYYESLILNYLTGSRLKNVPGFPGGARNLALISGEVEGLLVSFDGLGELASLPGLKVLLRLNDLPLPHGLQAPLLADFARGPDKAALLQLVEAHARLGRISALPPKAARPVLAEFRGRFAGLMADAGFLRDASAHDYAIEPTPGDQVAARISEVLRVGGPVPAALRRAIDCGRAAIGGRTACGAGT